MKNPFIFKVAATLMIVMLALAALPVMPAEAASRYAVATGNWNSTAT